MSELSYMNYIAMILLGLNVAQALFWSWQTQKLVNKLMCRDLAEYKYVSEGPKEKPKSFEDYEEELEDKAILNELNGMLPR